MFFQFCALYSGLCGLYSFSLILRVELPLRILRFWFENNRTRTVFQNRIIKVVGIWIILLSAYILDHSLLQSHGIDPKYNMIMEIFST